MLVIPNDLVFSDGPFGLEDLWVEIPEAFMPHVVPSNRYLRPRVFQSRWAYTTEELDADGGFVGHGPPEWQRRALRVGSDAAERWRPEFPRPAADVHWRGVIEAIQWRLDTGAGALDISDESDY